MFSSANHALQWDPKRVKNYNLIIGSIVNDWFSESVYKDLSMPTDLINLVVKYVKTDLVFDTYNYKIRNLLYFMCLIFY